MIINNVDLIDIDIFDADTAEKYEDALKEVEAVTETVKDMKLSDSVKAQCNSIFKVFNILFGEGTDKKVFGDKVNLLVCIKAFGELVEQVNKQKSAMEEIADKYSPNRAQRRKK